MRACVRMRDPTRDLFHVEQPFAIRVKRENIILRCFEQLRHKSKPGRGLIAFCFSHFEKIDAPSHSADTASLS